MKIHFHLSKLHLSLKRWEQNMCNSEARLSEMGKIGPDNLCDTLRRCLKIVQRVS